MVFLNNHLPNSSKKQPNNSSHHPKSSIEKQQQHNNKTRTTNLSDEMIQMISEREREMFDYHATSRKQQEQQPQNHKIKHKNMTNTSTTLKSSISTMEQIYCQKCHLLLPKSRTASTSNSKTTTSSSSSLSCCFWLVSIKNYISRKLRRRKTTIKHENNKYDKCKEFDSASVEEEFCSCEKQLK